MIHKLVKGKGFRGVLNYLMHGPKSSPAERGTIIASNMGGLTPRQLAKEFGFLRQLRPSLGKAVFHASLSLPPEDRQVRDAEFAEIAQAYLAGMGFHDCPFAVIRHHDTHHQHVHVLASRIRLDGSVVSDKQDFQRGETLMRELEKKYELQPVAPSSEATRKPLSRGQQQLKKRGEPIMQNKLADILDRGLKQTNTVMEFITWCETQQVYVEPHLQGENIAGLVYEYQGVRFRGSDLGRGYAWLGITKKLVYDPAKDIATLRQRLALRQKPALRMTVMESPRKKRDMKRRVQDADYWSKVQELFAEAVKLDFSHDAIAIHFPEGGKIIDHGDRINVENMDTLNAVDRLIRLAKQKDWRNVSFTGTEDFVRQAMTKALMEGLNVVASDDGQQAMLDNIRQGMGLFMQEVPVMENQPEPEAVNPPPPPALGSLKLGQLRQENQEPQEVLRRSFKLK